ncbi:NAD(P)-dependent oxidoreductase [Microbacterium sp.]|uniref:NAD(P)-dependent oxidoreductase n=1 Tax=Microbacterium sp. TaxID=51671 RepID=UPI003A90FC65
MTTLGFLGLGAMGRAMAGRLLEAGHAVTVWNRSRGHADALVAAGASRAATPAEALGADISFSMLANDEAAEDVLSVLDTASGRIHVNCASLSPEAADRLAARFIAAGARYISAPVLGRPQVAEAGKLNILAAGAAADINAALPYLEVLGARVWRMGDRPSVANAVKVSVNYNIIHAIQALGESIAMVERNGVDPALFVELLTSSLFGGVAYSGYGTEIVSGTYVPAGFAMSLGYKDLTLAKKVADAAGVRAATMSALFDVFERALAESDLAEADWGAAAEVTRRDLL